MLTAKSSISLDRLSPGEVVIAGVAQDVQREADGDAFATLISHRKWW